ncbi:MAG: hypothetical protein ACOZQL_20420 [Myxococcota bacterium]
MQRPTLFTAALLLLGTPALADTCRLYAGPDQSGDSKSYPLPGVWETLSPVSWSTSSRRALSGELPASVRDNTESVRIEAHDSSIELFLFSGDNMDGTFERLGCSLGHVCNLPVTTLANKVRSINCQRDNRPASTQLPLPEIANQLTIQLDAEMPKSSKIADSFIRYGQLLWTNVRARCERDGVGCGAGWEFKYKDVLEYRGKFSLVLNPPWLTREYDVWFRFWIDPELTGPTRALRLEETWYKITVEPGLLAQQISDGLESGIDGLFDGEQDLGDQLTTGLYDAVDAMADGGVADQFLSGLDRLVPRFDCSASSFDMNTPLWPGHTYTAANQSNPCQSALPAASYAPRLRLLRVP